MIAAKLANMRQGERTDLGSIDPKLSLEQAAELLNVGRKTVVRVKAVEREARRFGGPGWPGGLERLSAPQVGG